MKKIIATLILCSMLLSITGCSNSNPDFENDTMLEDDQKTNIESEQSIDKEENTNLDKEVIVPKKANVTEVVYQEVIPILNNRIIVKQAGLYGMIDNLGNVVMPITQVNPIEPLNANSVMFLKDNKFGVLSIYGDELLPAVYDNIHAINDDLISLETYDTYIKNGILYQDINGRQYVVYSISEAKFVGEKIIGQNVHFYAAENIISASWSDTSTGESKNYFVVYNIDGTKIYYAEEYVSGDFYTCNGENYIVTNKKIFDFSGNLICDLSNTPQSFVCSNDLMCFRSEKVLVHEFSKSENLHYYYVLNLNNFEITPIESIPENVGISEVKDNRFYEIYQRPKGTYYTYYGLMNDKFQIIVEPIYDTIEDCVNGYFPIELNDCVGYVDESGHLTLPPKVSKSVLNSNGYFSYNFVVNDGSLIDPRTGELLPYQKAELLHDAHYESGIFHAILTDENTGEKYKSFVTWDGPIVDHKFPNTKITLSQDGKVAVYNKGALYTIVELQ